jgi:reactive intermediate/imine deaminase
VVCALAILVSIASCSAGPPREVSPVPQFFPSADPALASFPFSEAVQVGHLLFVSGQIGNAPGSDKLVPGGIVPESKQALENIRSILARHGSSLDQVVKCTVFLADMHDWPAFNDVYRAYFPGRFPARSALGASGLARAARVEVECLAYVPREPR